MPKKSRNNQIEKLKKARLLNAKRVVFDGENIKEVEFYPLAEDPPVKLAGDDPIDNEIMKDLQTQLEVERKRYG